MVAFSLPGIVSVPTFRGGCYRATCATGGTGAAGATGAIYVGTVGATMAHKQLARNREKQTHWNVQKQYTT